MNALPADLSPDSYAGPNWREFRRTPLFRHLRLMAGRRASPYPQNVADAWEAIELSDGHGRVGCRIEAAARYVVMTEHPQGITPWLHL